MLRIDFLMRFALPQWYEKEITSLLGSRPKDFTFSAEGGTFIPHF